MINRDSYGAIGHRRQDGSLEMGDSACWTGHHKYLGSNHLSMRFFEKGFGGYCRYPDKWGTDNAFGAYYKNPWQGCMSRDQLTGIIAGLIKEASITANLRFIIHHAFSGFLFSYNTIHNGKKPGGYKLPDLTLLDFWAMELRMFGKFSWIFWPLLCVLDIHMLLNTIYFNKHDEDNDQINFAMKHFIGVEHVPTVISWLAWKMCNKDKLKWLLSLYWRGWRKQPGMFDLYERRI